MKTTLLVVAAVLLVLCPRSVWADPAPTVPDAPPADRNGTTCISTKDYPVPADSKVIGFDGGDFETSGSMPPKWGGSGKIVAASDAPQGKSYYQMSGKKGSYLNSPEIPATGGQPCFFSFWVKAPNEPFVAVHFTSTEREPTFTNIYFMPAPSGNQWRHIGYYFIIPPQCKSIAFELSVRDGMAGDQDVSVDDVQVRTASDAELATAYQTERSNFPTYDMTPHPGDGKDLVLTLAKLEGKAGLPGKPFVIWALGSSFTDRLGDGEELIQDIRQKFPKAPPIIYRKHGGPGTPWEYVYCWTRQFVDYEQPDLILSYTSGTAEGLEEMLHDIRSRTTAEVIIPTLHLHPNENNPKAVETGMSDWPTARTISAKHDVEFVENRRELAAYLTANNLDPEALLFDHNHENQHGRIRIYDNIFRHFVHSDQATYTPESRERLIALTPPQAKSATEEVTLSGNWKQDGGVLSSSAAGDHLKIAFTGNELDLIGRASATGGSVKVLVDGVPGDQAPVFVTNYIQPNRNVWRIPHLADLGPNLVPQKWTIAMTSNTGDFSVTGSVTGADGTGNLNTPFKSNSGQISLDPKNWRQGHVTPPRPGFPEYAVQTGDTFSFDVTRAAQGEMSLKGDASAPLVQPIVRNLPNGPHTVELITTGDGDVALQNLYVYQPPEKD